MNSENQANPANSINSIEVPAFGVFADRKSTEPLFLSISAVKDTKDCFRQAAAFLQGMCQPRAVIRRARAQVRFGNIQD